jgi:hypothetical protein
VTVSESIRCQETPSENTVQVQPLLRAVTKQRIVFVLCFDYYKIGFSAGTKNKQQTVNLSVHNDGGRPSTCVPEILDTNWNR